MSGIQFFILAVVIIVAWRLYGRWHAGELTFTGFIEWLALWLAVGVVSLVPQVASYLALLVGVGRGVDLVTYLALILLFYLIFKVFVRLERLDRTLTTVVRALALKDTESKPTDTPKVLPPAA